MFRIKTETHAENAGTLTRHKEEKPNVMKILEQGSNIHQLKLYSFMRIKLTVIGLYIPIHARIKHATGLTHVCVKYNKYYYEVHSIDKCANSCMCTCNCIYLVHL